MPDGPTWLDELGPAFRAAIRAAQPRGRMTYRDLDAVLPERDVTSKQIEMILAHLHEEGIELVEDDRRELG